MAFYTRQHIHYCGIDLHARSLYLCILDQESKVLVHRQLPCEREALLKTLAPYREDLVVAVECLFCWYWVADLCIEEGITFVLGHALAMKAIHGGKSKNDRIDSFKIASLLRGGNLAFYLLRSIPGIGEILAMTLLYEIDDIGRFPRVQNFLSYARLVKGEHSSAGKKKKSAGAKMGNVHLKWALSEAAALFLRANPIGQKFFTRLERKHGKGKALSILAAKLGRAVYYMLLRGTVFDLNKFVTV